MVVSVTEILTPSWLEEMTIISHPGESRHGAYHKVADLAAQLWRLELSTSLLRCTSGFPPQGEAR